MSRNYSMTEIRASLPKDKSCVSSVWVNYVIRPLSFYVTWLFDRLGLTANVVSYLSAIVAVLGAVCLGMPSHAARLIGALLFNAWLLLDCVDGNLARLHKTAGPRGEFADAVGGYSAVAVGYLAVGYAAARTSPVAGMQWLLVGGLISIANLYTRIINLKYLQLLGDKNGTKHVDKIGRLAWLVRKSEIELGISGAFMPALIISSIFDEYRYILIGSAIVWLGLTVGVVLGRIMQAERRV